MMSNNKLNLFFEKFASRVTFYAGRPIVFIFAFIIILLWIGTGPIFNYSDTWQLIINTGTTIITFLMVFLIQQSQNKDSLAIQLKLNELVASIDGASNRLINVQDLSEEDLLVLHKFYKQLSIMAKKDEKLNNSHSVDEAVERHKSKMSKYAPRNHSSQPMMRPYKRNRNKTS